MSTATFVTEFESGTYAGHDEHPHNGYYAGDFGPRTPCTRSRATLPTSATHRTSRTQARATCPPRR